MDEGRARRIGQRVRAARRQRGLSLNALAQLAGLSLGFLSMVENGQRLLDRASHITALAEAMRISPSELMGAPLPPVEAHGAAAHEMIPALRHTLMGISLTTPPEHHGVAPPTWLLAGKVADANRLYHAAEYGALAVTLPGLLTDLATAVSASRGHDRRDLLRLLADAYYPACTLLLKNLGYIDLAFIAVTRASEAIDELEDPLCRALSLFFRAHVLMSAGTPSQAVSEAADAMRLVESGPESPDAYALLGELHLISAAAIAQDRRLPGRSGTESVRAHLAEAEDLAARTGETQAWQLNFGPTNVGIHQVTLHTDLGLHGEAVALSSNIRPRALMVPGRQAAFHTDLGRSLAQLRRRESDAVTALLTAEHLAPQRVRANALVHDTVGFLLDRTLSAHTARDLRGLAHRMGMPV